MPSTTSTRISIGSLAGTACNGRLAHVTPGGDGSLSPAELTAAPRLNRPWQTFRVPDEMVYVRAELVGGNGRRAWTQPFFIERDPPQPA